MHKGREFIWINLVTPPPNNISLSSSCICESEVKMKGKIEVAELFMLQFQDQPRTDHHHHHHHHFQEEKQEQEGQGYNNQDPEPTKEKRGDTVAVHSQEPILRPSLGELSAVDEENDGFITPTSSEHKIPAVTQCPPAPRKPTAAIRRAIPMKRRTTPKKVSRRLHFDDQVLNNIIPPKILASFFSRLMKPPKDQRN